VTGEPGVTWGRSARRPRGSGAMFSASLRARFQLPGLSVPWPRAYSPHHCLCHAMQFVSALPGGLLI